ncbi:hypothetical protein IPM62_01815 [Candidatus Woesebacteria bacterium]|nr:MAG: hypothetical protein IPM62_01815 [Candidatus Woesebacteria bacterium]
MTTEFEPGPKCPFPDTCIGYGGCQKALIIDQEIHNLTTGLAKGESSVLQTQVDQASCNSPEFAIAKRRGKKCLKDFTNTHHSTS